MFECKKLERHGNGETLGNSSYVQAEGEIELGCCRCPISSSGRLDMECPQRVILS